MRDRDVSPRWLVLLLPLVFVLGLLLADRAEKAWSVRPVADPPAPLPAPEVPGPIVEKRPWEAEDLPMRVGGEVSRPVPVYSPQPRSTQVALRAGVHGDVILEAVIDLDGRVTDVRVLKGLPLGLDRQATDAVRTWRFQPATLHGKPVKVYFTIIVTFSGKR
jgi:TonB family protein